MFFANAFFCFRAYFAYCCKYAFYLFLYAMLSFLNYLVYFRKYNPKSVRVACLLRNGGRHSHNWLNLAQKIGFGKINTVLENTFRSYLAVTVICLTNCLNRKKNRNENRLLYVTQEANPPQRRLCARLRRLRDSR